MPASPLRRSKLIGEGQSFMSSILPTGMRAVATQIAADTSAGGFILPNDYVDVIMTRRASKTGGAGDGFITETILKNIRVLAIDQTIQEDDKGQKVKVGADGHAGTDAAAGRDHHRRPADGRPSHAGAALGRSTTSSPRPARANIWCPAMAAGEPYA